MRLRAAYRNRIFFGFTIKKASEQTGISEATLHRHLKIMKREGWVREDRGNLLIVGVSKLDSKYREIYKVSSSVHVIKIPLFRDKLEQKIFFHKCIAEDNIRKQRYSISKKRKILVKSQSDTHRLTKQELKKIDKAGGVKRFAKTLGKTLLERTTLSNNGISRLCKVSKRTASKRQKQWSDRGYFIIKPHYSTLIEKGCSSQHYRNSFSASSGELFFYGEVKKRGSNTVTLPRKRTLAVDTVIRIK